MTVNELNPTYKIGMTEWGLLVCGFVLLIFVYQMKVDFMIADFIFGHFQWRFEKSFLIEVILHRFARYMVIFVFLIILSNLVVKILKANDPAGIYHLFVLLLTISTSVILVTIIKRIVEVDCPWDLIRYGGNKPYFPVFDYDPEYLPSAHCFPASHASVGFSWMALFFYYKVTKKVRNHKILGLILIIGVIFGFAQQLRGAHFISHDICSFLICLINPMVIYSIAYRKAFRMQIVSR